MARRFTSSGLAGAILLVLCSHHAYHNHLAAVAAPPIVHEKCMITAIGYRKATLETRNSVRKQTPEHTPIISNTPISTNQPQAQQGTDGPFMQETQYVYENLCLHVQLLFFDAWSWVARAKLSPTPICQGTDGIA